MKKPLLASLACHALPLILSGCSSTPRVIPVNEINQPVFYQGNYASIGSRDEVQWGSALDRNVNLNPFVSLEWNVNSWASYTMTPLYWNFLLTGNQYESSGSTLRRFDEQTFTSNLKLGFQETPWNSIHVEYAHTHFNFAEGVAWRFNGLTFSDGDGYHETFLRDLQRQ